MTEMDEVQKILSEALPNDQVLVEKTWQFLNSEPKYLEAFLLTSPSAIAERPGRDDGTLDETESMRAQYREFIGTEIVEGDESDEPWVLIPDLHPDVQKIIQVGGVCCLDKMLLDKVKNEIDAMVKELYEESDQEKWCIIVALLMTNPEHYSELAKVKDVDMPTLRACLDAMLHQAFAIVLKRMAADSGISLHQGMKNAQASIVPASLAAGAAAIQASNAFRHQAMLVTLVHRWSRIYGPLLLVTGNPVGAVLSYLGFFCADVAETVAATQYQRAARMETMTSVCTFGARAGSVLTLGMLGWELSSNIRQYWKGEIDGHTCAENLTASFGATAASLAGSCGAVALCAGAGPWGLLFAGIAGGAAASALTGAAVKKLFRKLFGAGRERSLQQAYGILQLKPGASPQEVRQAYLNLAKQTHPDKVGGNREEFVKINSAYELIRASILS